MRYARWTVAGIALVVSAFAAGTAAPAVVVALAITLYRQL